MYRESSSNAPRHPETAVAPAPESYTGRRCHVPEPSHRQLSQEHPHAFAIGIHDVHTGPSHADELGASVLLCTDRGDIQDRKSTRLNSSHGYISYAVFCLKKKTSTVTHT